jgi:hypothetical protein
MLHERDGYLKRWAATIPDREAAAEVLETLARLTDTP